METIRRIQLTKLNRNRLIQHKNRETDSSSRKYEKAKQNKRAKKTNNQSTTKNHKQNPESPFTGKSKIYNKKSQIIQASHVSKFHLKKRETEKRPNSDKKEKGRGR